MFDNLGRPLGFVANRKLSIGSIVVTCMLPCVPGCNRGQILPQGLVWLWVADRITG